MDILRLVEQVSSPALHRTLLGGFSGPYSLGVGRDAASEAVLILSVPSSVKQAFPARVTVAGESVPVQVQHDFKAPVPLSGASERTRRF